MMAGVIGFACFYSADASVIKDAKKKKNEAQQNLDNINQQINNIQSEQSKVKSQMAAYDEQLMSLLTDMELLKTDIDNKEGEIDQAKTDLAAAQEKEQQQYADMKKRIQYMYENGDDTFLDALVESEDISDLLNRVEYVSEVYSYDRELLVAYQETVQQVADLESQLEQELADMEELKQSYDQQEASLNQVINENMLPSSYTSADMGRVTSGAAMALLGKIYLTFHKWTEARNVLSQLVGRYSLMTTPEQVFDVNNKMNDEIIFAVRFNKDVEGEGHGYWFSIINLTDDTNQTKSLKECYKDGDKRKNLITYVKVEDKVCVMNKFKDVKSATYNTVGNDQIILRYADVLLMYAEALNEISYSNLQNSEAMVALNAVHTRAGLSPLQITELPDQDSFRKAIMLERQQEFPYEGQRWFDLVRMGGAKEAMKAEGHIIQDYQFLYPIPKTELERINNTELLWQNTGY